MKFEITADFENKLIRVTASGAIRAIDTGRMAEEGLACGNTHGISNYLIDYRLCHVEDSTVDTFSFMSNLGEVGIPKSIRIAIVIKDDSDDHQFAETVARNRGWNIRYFDSLAAAEQWLATNGNEP